MEGKYTRQAVLRVSRGVFQSLLPEGLDLAGAFDSVDSPAECAVVHDMLALPENARVTGVNKLVFFSKDQVAVRVECPDFKMTPVGATLMEVDAVVTSVYGRPRFVRWEGSALDPTREKPRTWRDREPLL